MKKTALGNILRAATLAVAGSLMLVGCSMNPTKVTANKSPSYVEQPKKIYGLIAMAPAPLAAVPFFPDLDKTYTDAFTGTMDKILRGCNVAFATSVVDKELTAEQMKAAAKEFDPDVFLQVMIKSYRHQGNKMVDATYDASIHDPKSREMVWRANLEFDLTIDHYSSGFVLPPEFFGARGAALAVDLTNQMKKDGILAECPLIADKPASGK